MNTNLSTTDAQAEYPDRAMLFKVVDGKPVAYIRGDDDRPDGKTLLTIGQTVDRFGEDHDKWVEEWRSLLGRYFAPDEPTESDPTTAGRRGAYDPLELLPPTQDNLRPGRFYVPDGDPAIGVISYVDQGAFTAIMLAGPYVTAGDAEGERLTNVKGITSLTVFDLAERLRPLAAAADYRERSAIDSLIVFDVSDPEPATCVSSDQAPDGRRRLTAEQCAMQFGGTADEWRAKWKAKFGMFPWAQEASAK